MSKIIDVKEIVEKYILNFPDRTQLAIGVIDNKEVHYFGCIKLDSRMRNISNKKSVFDIGSVGKVFTAAVLADLVVNEGLSISSKVADLFEYDSLNAIDDRLIDLANHTSGFESRRDDFDVTAESLRSYYGSFDEKEMISSLKTLSLYNESKKGKYEYSNFGFGLLGYALEKYKDIPFKELLKSKVFDKYEMSNTFLNSAESMNLVAGLDEEGNEVKNWNMDALIGAGGHYSTVEDLTKFLLAHFDSANETLGLTRTPTHTVDEGMKVGLGLHVVKGSKDVDVFWHNGASSGYKSAIEFNVESKSGIVVFSNVSFFNKNHWDVDRICTSLMNLLIEKNHV